MMQTTFFDNLLGAAQPLSVRAGNGTAAPTMPAPRPLVGQDSRKSFLPGLGSSRGFLPGLGSSRGFLPGLGALSLSDPKILMLLAAAGAGAFFLLRKKK